jgi:uncharacterized protein with GYD domain
MPNYLLQVAYSREGWEALVKHPQNRIEAVTPAIEKLGGKVKHAWFSFGDHDVVLVTEMPDNVSAAAIAIAFAGGAHANQCRRLRCSRSTKPSMR